MNKTKKYLYNIIFWISRIFSISLFSICFFAILNAKYAISEKYFYLLFDFAFSDNSVFYSIFYKVFFEWLHNIIYTNNNIEIIGLNSEYSSFSIFCKNSQNIDLLLIILVLILIISILIIKKYNKRYKYLLLIVISSFVYITTYLIFKAPIMLALAIVVPITFVLIQILNKICPIQKVVMLIPIIGDIFCTRNIVKYIYKNSSERIKDIVLLIVALTVSNTVCFLFQYKTDRDFENRIMNNWTYSIRPYQDKLIISGNKELIIIDKRGKNFNIKNDEFICAEDFIIDERKKEIYCYNFYNYRLLILNLETLNIIKKVIVQKNRNVDGARIYFNGDFSKLIAIYEYCNIGCLIDLSTYNIKHIRGVAELRDGLIYNKYRNCFLISFHDENSFFQEIDIDNKKIRNIKADKYQGYLAISNKNKEIYVAFHQQGQIGVYDAQTMKLKRKIKSNYTVKNITYDEELNVLIAPSYFTGYVDIFLMDGTDKLLTREFVGYELREACFDPQKENLYVCSVNGLYKKKIDIKRLIEENSKKQ